MGLKNHQKLNMPPRPINRRKVMKEKVQNGDGDSNLAWL